ncbi:MAG: hypothetical protein Q8S03_16740 [Brevundimonas sp.]|uniref:hypothetical protein n=1 Tax=Brevundimonas sp. TaxID=1871086 RepID=UPI0027351A10|nr:hypothetical protein [Brevundimonas sp.]MDP3406340.1 hypothetical protein [Brevundimonas sp.]
MRRLVVGLSVVAVLGAGACQQAEAPADAPAAEAASAPQPGQTMAETFGNCEWGEVTGSGLSIWSYACGPEAGNVRLVADDSLPGFAIESTGEGEAARRPAIMIFKKAADASVESIVEAVRAKSPGPHSATCTLQPVTFEGAVPGSFGFEPTGAVKAAWDAFASGDGEAEPVEPPCGDLGPQMAGDRSFRVVEGDPTTVVFIEYGSEIQIFDPATLRPAT